MRAVIQRVKRASVYIEDNSIADINKGLVVLVGIENGDSIEDINYTADKILGLRIFEDEDGKMNRSVMDVNGEVLIVSQFTLLGDARKGRRPSFIRAAKPDEAKNLYEALIDLCKKKGAVVKSGKFQAEMLVKIYNDGPVTILLDSKKQF